MSFGKYRLLYEEGFGLSQSAGFATSSPKGKHPCAYTCTPRHLRPGQVRRRCKCPWFLSIKINSLRVSAYKPYRLKSALQLFGHALRVRADYLLTRLPNYLITYLPISPITCLPVYLSTCFPVSLLTYIPDYLFTCLPYYLH